MTKRKILSVFFAAVLSIGMMLLPCTASAVENSKTQDGLVAVIVSEKDYYSADEDINLTFKVTNTNDYAVENVSLEAIIPDGLTLKNGTDTKADTVSLASGESLELTLTAVKSSEQVTTASENETSAESTTNTQSQGNSANTDNSNTSASKSNGNSNNNSANNAGGSGTSVGNSNDNSTVATGQNAVFAIVCLICLCALLAVIFFAKTNKKITRSLSIVLSVCIAVSAVTTVVLPTAAASNSKSCEVEKIISVDNDSYAIKAKVTYDKNNSATEDENAVTRGEWVDMLVSEFSMSGEVTKNVENPFTDIAGSEYCDSIIKAYYFAVLPDEGEKFKPDENATRDFAAYTLNNCLGYVKNDDLVCDDFDSIKYQDAASALVERGYFELENNKFMPQKSVTKDEMQTAISLIEKVNESVQIDENYDNKVEYKDDVITLPESYVISESENTIVLTQNDETEVLKAGDAFIIKPADESALYSSYKVESVTIDDGKVTVVTSAASLGDILTDIDVQGRAIAQVGGASLRSSRSNIKYSDSNPLDEDKLTFSKDLIKLPEKGIELTISGGLKNPVIDYAVDMDFTDIMGVSIPTKVNNVYVALSDTFEIGGDFKIDLQKFSGEAATVHLVTYEVSLYGIIGVRVQVDINISADGEVALSYSINNTLGAQISQDGQSEKLSFRTIKDFREHSFNYDVKITAAIEPKVELSLLVCEIELLSADATLGAHGSAETKNFKHSIGQNHTSFNAYLSFSMSAGIGGDLKDLLNMVKEIELFGYKPFGNIDVSKLTATLTVWDSDNSPAKINVHLENGKIVDSCTYRYVSGKVKCDGFPVEGVSVTVYDGDTQIALSEGQSNLSSEAGNFGFLIPCRSDYTNYSDKLTFKFTKDSYTEYTKAYTVKTADDTDLGTIEMKKSSGEDEENYREDFINALLSNEDEWHAFNGYAGEFISFCDLDFDGNLELIISHPGGTMRNNSFSAYYLKDNKVALANVSQKDDWIIKGVPDGVLKGYYDSKTDTYKIIEKVYWQENSSAMNYWIGNCELNFDGENLTTDYYSSMGHHYDYNTQDENYQYYDGANGYVDITGANEISESEYNRINEEKLENLVDINMKREFIYCSDWETYSDSEKRQALEKAYDSFTYDKY